MAKEIREEVIPLTLRPALKDTEYIIQLIDGVYTVDITTTEWTHNYKFKSRNALCKWVKGVLKEEMNYRLGYTDDCFIEDVKYRILEVLQDYIDLIGEVFIVK